MRLSPLSCRISVQGKSTIQPPAISHWTQLGNEEKEPGEPKRHVLLRIPTQESSGVMEQRAVVRFLTLKELSTKDIITELEELYGYKALSLSAVKKRRKRFANRRISLEDNSESRKPAQSDLCESVRAFIEESLFITCKHTCQKLQIAKTTCLRVLHEHLGFRKCYFRWVPHSMTDDEAQYQVTFPRNFFKSGAVPEKRPSTIY
jgi:hypothetical protein